MELHVVFDSLMGNVFVQCIVGVILTFSLFPALIKRLWYIYVTYNSDSEGTDLPLPPGELGYPLIGETVQFIRKNAEFYSEKGEKYGDVYMTHTLGRPTIRVRGAEYLRVILTGENTLVTSNWPSSIRRVFGEGALAMSEGEIHKFKKKIIIRAFTHQALASYIPAILPIMRMYFKDWILQGDVLGYDICKELAFALATRILMGCDFDQDYVLKLANLFESMIYNMFSLPIAIPGLGLWKALKFRKELHAEFHKCIEKIEKEGSSQSFKSAIHLIMDGRTEREYSKEELADTVQELFFTGHETVASTMTSLLMYIGRDPTILQRVRDELKEAGMLDCSDEELDVSLKKLCELKFISSVVREVVRIAPAVGAGYRKAIKTFELGKYRVPKGWTVAFGVRDTHHTSPIYKDAQSFDPSRWDSLPNLDRQDRQDKGSDVDRMNFAGFGAGARYCVGKEYAKLVLRIFVIELARNYNWKLQNPFPKMLYIPVPRAVDRLPLHIHKRSGNC